MRPWFAQQWRLLTGSYRLSTAILCAALIAIFCADFFSRLAVFRDASVRRFEAPAAVSIVSPPAVDEIKKFVEAWAAPPPQEVAAPVERKMVLQGVFGTRADRSAAVALFPPEGGSPERVRATVGAPIEGWTVKRIDAERVILSRGEESRELLLFRSGDSPAKP
jgi:hypothetical protein